MRRWQKQRPRFCCPNQETPGVTRSWRGQEGFSTRAFGGSVSPSKPCFPAPELWENKFQLFWDTKFPAALETNTNGRIALENCFAVSYKTKQRSTMWLSSWTPTERKTKTYTGMVIAVFFFIIARNQKQSPMFNDSWINKQYVIDSHNGLSFGNKKEQTINTHDDMNKSQKQLH